jgi:hypothetical protein
MNLTKRQREVINVLKAASKDGGKTAQLSLVKIAQALGVANVSDIVNALVIKGVITKQNLTKSRSSHDQV